MIDLKHTRPVKSGKAGCEAHFTGQGDYYIFPLRLCGFARIFKHMKQNLIKSVIGAALIMFSVNLSAQETGNSNPGVVSGNISIIAQQYNDDAKIGAVAPPERMAMNAFSNILYRKGKFYGGIRIESYNPSLLGYPVGYNGTGIGYFFGTFSTDRLSVTAGTFYEQFGLGMVLRTYEENNLGIDNSIVGVRVKYNAGKGIYLKGVYGKQRFKFDSKIIQGPGIVRGFDAEWQINDAFNSLFKISSKQFF